MNLSDPVDVIARTIWGENRSGGARGMQSVANVVMNRVAQPGWWGTDVISVCLRAWQFSAWNADDPNLPKLQEVDETDPVFVTALEIAAEAIAGTLPDIVHGATSYKETSLPWPAAWGPEVQPVAIVAGQSFYILLA